MSSSFNYFGKLVFDWTVSGLLESDEEAIYSPIFCAPPPFDGIKWKLEVCPNGDFDEDDEGYVSLNLILVEPKDVPIKVDFKMGFVNEAKKWFEDYCDRTSTGDVFDYSGHYIWGSMHLITRDEISDPKLGILSKGDVNLRCEITFNENIIEKKREVNLTDLSNDLGKMLITEDFADVVLEAEDQQVKAHKSILVSRSSVFKATFEPNTKESLESIVQINAMGFDVLQTMVTFLYTGSVDPKVCTFDLLEAAERYDIKSLKKICQKIVASRMTSLNVIQTLFDSEKLNAKDLVTSCIEYIAKNLKEVKQTEEWTEIKAYPEIMMQIMDMIAENVTSFNSNLVN